MFSVCRQLVSSYSGKFGSVQYYVRALMERASQPALECKKSFEVEEPLDVNTPDLLVRNRDFYFFLILALSSILYDITLSLKCLADRRLDVFSLLQAA